MALRQQIHEAGFTLVELVAVILLLGILAAFALPKFFELGSYSGRAAYDEVASALRYAQKLAVAGGCDVRAQISATGYSLQQLDGCTSGSFVILNDSHPLSQNSFTGVAISPAVTLDFDAMGRVSSSTTILVDGRNISVVAETGYVGAP